MSDLTPGNRLDRPVDDKFDHILGPPNAAVTLVAIESGRRNRQKKRSQATKRGFRP